MQRNIFSLILVLFAFVSCMQKTREELVVGTWKLNIDKEERKITFYKDMTMQMTSSESMSENKSGTYKLVHDGKYLYTYEKGHSDTDELEILSINETTMQLRAAKDSRIILLTKDTPK